MPVGMLCSRFVGIAGEDDLDAPDLITPTNQTSTPTRREGVHQAKVTVSSMAANAAAARQKLLAAIGKSTRTRPRRRSALTS